MTKGVACADDGVVACVYAYMRIFNSVIPASKIQSSRPPSRDLPPSRHTGRYEVSIRYLPNSLASLKWPFKEIPAQEHAGMTKGGGMRG